MSGKKFVPQKNAHWYQEDGTPMFEIPKKGGGGMKKPNINDARELGLLPSVTTILNCIDKPFLVAWLKNQILDASIAVSQEVGRLEDCHRQAVIKTSDEISNQAKETGLKIHKQVEAFVHDDWAAPDADLTFAKIGLIFAMLNLKDFQTETSFANPRYGFAGRVDLMGMASHPEHPRQYAIIDTKTQDTKGRGKFNLYPEMPLQLAAYATGTGHPTADLYSLMISTTEPGLVQLFWHPENDFYFYSFMEIFRVWKGPAVKAFDCKGIGTPQKVFG